MSKPNPMRGRNRWIKGLRRVGKALGYVCTVLVLTYVYLCVAGFPDGVVDGTRHWLHARGYDLRFDRLRLHPSGALQAGQTLFYLHKEDTLPTLEAANVLIHIHPSTVWHRGRQGGIRLEIANAKFRLLAHKALLEPVFEEPIEAHSFEATITWSDDEMIWEAVDAQAIHLMVQGEGLVERSADTQPGAAMLTMLRLREQMDEWPLVYRQILEEWHAMERVEPTHAHFVFAHRETQNYTHLDIRVDGGRTLFRGLPFDAWQVDVTHSDEGIHVSRALFVAGDQRIEGDLVYLREPHTLEMQVDAALSPTYWRNLLPPVVRDYKDRARIRLYGDAEVSMHVGPSPVALFGQSGTGQIGLKQWSAYDVWIENARSHVAFNEGFIKLDSLEALIGRDETRGWANGHAQYDHSSRRYRGQIEASLNPDEVFSVARYSEVAATLIQALSFDSAPPEINVEFSGGLDPEPQFHFAGQARGANFSFYGAQVNEFDAILQLTNRVLRMDPLYVKRPEGTLEGWYQQDFDRALIDLDVDSSVDPHILARIGGGMVERLLRPFRFEGDLSVQVKGRIDYEEHEETAYRAVGHGKRIGWRWVMADHLALEWLAEGRRVYLNDIRMDIYGGRLQGDMIIDRKQDEWVQYEVKGRVESVRLPEFLRAIRQDDGEAQEGLVSGQFALKGLVEDDWKASITGDGSIRISDGQIFQIPLFGGLSELLRRIYPRLGFAVQTDARAAFEIRDRKIESDSIRIEGTILSLRGHGHYHLDDRLNFKVQVIPLRRGLVVDAVRLVTYPVSRLLQVYLEGSLAEPRWGIDTLPRGLWRVFEREENDE